MADFDFGSILDKTLGAYQAVSVARLEKDTARYNNAGMNQTQTLHNSEAPTMTDAYKTGNVQTQNTGSVGSYIDRIPQPLLYGSLLLLGGALLLKAAKG